MNWLSSKSKPRRREIRRHKTDQGMSVWQRFNRAVGVGPVAIALLFLLLSTAIIFSGRGTIPYTLGERIDRTVPSRVDFEIENKAATRDALDRAGEQSPNVYVLNEALLKAVRGELSRLAAECHANDTYEKFAAAKDAKAWKLPKQGYEYLRKLDPKDDKTFNTALAELDKAIRETWVVRKVKEEERTVPGNALEVKLKGSPGIPEDQFRTVELTELYYTNSRYIRELAEKLSRQFDPTLQATVAGILERALVSKPIYEFSAPLTAKLMRQAEEAVKPVMRKYVENEPFLESGKPPIVGRIINSEAMTLLRAEHEAYTRFLNSDNPRASQLRRTHVLSQVGTGMLVLLVTIGLSMYTWSYQQRIVGNPTRCFALASLLLAMLAGAKAITAYKGFFGDYQENTVFFVVVCSTILTIVYTQRYALGMAFGLALLMTLAAGGDLGLLVILCMTAGAGVFMLREIRTRSKLVLVGLATAAVAIVCTTAVGLIARQALIGFIFRHALAAGLAALLSGFVIQGILPLIERAFKIATSISLLEYCDVNRPLLKRLAQEAPGTYNHCLVLSTLAEAAAEAIGANGLLTRVGCLYHDIGKINKPYYFAENQEARISRHDKLSPTMSLLIILGHVKDGIELAKEYGLPRVLVPFIGEHHGTTVVRYFHHAATEQAKKRKGRHDRDTEESEFRYPGPKPQSKETAILMLCDGVEGAIRTLAEPTPNRIESVVHQVLMDRLRDRQFDDCDITLKDLNRVEDALVKSLCRFYHGRVAYPKTEQKRETAS